jgi:exodeoxyribonuclease V alpha subunit
VLSDFIAAGGVPVVQLSQVFRQAEGSQIVANAHRINRGEMPVFPDRGGGGDCFFIAREDPQAGGEMVRHLFTERIPNRFGLDPRTDIQILCPMHRGATGTEALNRLIQEALNHDRPSLEHRGRIYHEGDRVMQTRNDYDTDIMNGDMGVVIRLDPVAGSVEVAFEGRTVLLQRQHLTDLEPAFAVTVHKSQGGEYPAVILPLFGEHHLMLRRNVLYTAVTRAQRLLVIVGTHKALHQAVRDDRMLRRSTELRAFLEGRPPVDVAPFEGE